MYIFGKTQLFDCNVQKSINNVRRLKKKSSLLIYNYSHYSESPIHNACKTYYNLNKICFSYK